MSIEITLALRPVSRCDAYPKGVPSETRTAMYEPHEADQMMTLRSRVLAGDVAAAQEMAALHELKVMFEGRILTDEEAGLTEVAPSHHPPTISESEQPPLFLESSNIPALNEARQAFERARGRRLNEHVERDNAADAPILTTAPEARARTEDPHTSHAAADSLSPEALRASQRAVWDCFRRYGPMHDELFVARYTEIHEAHGWPPQSPSGLRSRRDELVGDGWMRDTGETQKLQSGRHGKVWHYVTKEERAG